MDCCLSGFSVPGILKAANCSRKSFPLSGDLPDPGIKSRSSALQVDSLPSKPPGKPKQYATDNQWVKENKRGIKKCLETNENENTTYSVLWDVTKAVPRKKLMAVNTY